SWRDRPCRRRRRERRPRRWRMAPAYARDRPHARQCRSWRPVRPDRRWFLALSLPVRGGTVPRAAQHGARFFEFGGSIDAEWNGGNDGDVDPHASLDGAQLLELLAALERRRLQPDELLQRRATIGVKSYMMIERPLARRRGGTGEI